jgi:spermidine synthase
MFASYLFIPQPERALIVGLGGGGMVHFLKQFDPDLRLDVIEIDPSVIAVADEYFHVRSDAKLNIIKRDARDFLYDGKERYDVIYMDAFLDASDETDSTGVPLHLKTLPFFAQLRARITPEGLVVFNLHRNASLEQDLAVIRKAFPSVYVFRVPARGNVIVAASMAPTPLERAALRQRAAELDRNSQSGFSFTQLADNLVN